MRRSLLALALLLSATAAQAADCYPNAAGTQANCGVVNMFNNGSGQSVPVTSVAPLPVSANTEGTKATYRTVVNSGVDGSGVIFQIQGSASKVVKVTRISISGKLTTGAAGIIVVQRYSTAASGGASGTPTIVPLDATNAVATAAVLNYSAVPTAGSSVGAIGMQYTYWNAPASGSNVPAIWEFGTRPSQAVTLRGTAQFLAVRTAGFNAYTGVDFTLEVEWTEE